MEHEAVLFANEAFYRAFADRDIAAMDAIWARQLPVACIHPGWGLLAGRTAIMESWHAILDGGGAFDIACRRPRVFLFGETAFVICFEAVGDSFLIATNVFAREDGTWRMVHHQAGPTTDRPDAEEEPEGLVH